jgi:hypothetical protein
LTKALIDRIQDTSGGLWNVIKLRWVLIENIVVEQSLPSLFLVGFEILKGQHRVLQCGERWAVMFGTGRIPKPIIDERVEIANGLDLMPPHAGNQDSVSGSESCGKTLRFGNLEPWESFKVRAAKIDQTDRLTCWREI